MPIKGNEDQVDRISLAVKGVNSSMERHDLTASYHNQLKASAVQDCITLGEDNLAGVCPKHREEKPDSKQYFLW